MSQNAAILSEKIRTLSPDQIAEVEDFIEFLLQRGRERALTRSAEAVSTPAFAATWDNPEDDVYDAL